MVFMESISTLAKRNEAAERKHFDLINRHSEIIASIESYKRANS
jgi:hypothetical protein